MTGARRGRRARVARRLRAVWELAGELATLAVAILAACVVPAKDETPRRRARRPA